MIIAINNNKGGVLKTTTTSNLAGVLATKKKKVLLVDADNQANLAISFGLNPDNFRTTLYDVLVGGVPPEDAIVKVHDYIDLLPSNDELVAFEFDVIGEYQRYPNPFYIMKNALSHLREAYDYILIDTPPSLSLMNGNVFTFADGILLPYEPEAYSMRSLLAVHRTILDFQKQHNPQLKVLGMLFTKVVQNSNLHIGIMQDTRKYASLNNLPIFDTIIPRTVQYANAVGFDRTPLTLMKKSEKGKLYFDLWAEIEKQLEMSEIK